MLGSSYLSDEYKTYIDDLKTCLRHGKTKNNKSCHHRQSVYEDVCLLLDHPNFSDILNSFSMENSLVPFVKTMYVASIRKSSLCYTGCTLKSVYSSTSVYQCGIKTANIEYKELCQWSYKNVRTSIQL